jgi:hypothetical protein
VPADLVVKGATTAGVAGVELRLDGSSTRTFFLTRDHA